jgi:hypothetical protein
MLIEITFVHLAESKKNWIFTVLQQIEGNGIVVVTLLFKITVGGFDPYRYAARRFLIF